MLPHAHPHAGAGARSVAKACCLLWFALSQAAAVDLTRATIVAPAGLQGPEAKAVQMLVEEVERRSHVRLPVAAPQGASPAIAIRVSRAPQGGAREGFRLRSGPDGVTVVGNDPRGMLFGVGRLLRELRMERSSLTLPDGLSLAAAPRSGLRGHQLGYRPKPNSYDGWTVAMWEQYVRDLAVFGTNAIELVPPRTDDAPDSPHFPLPQQRMMAEMSRIAADYGLDVWVWYPAIDKDYADPKAVEAALAEWASVLGSLPRVDAVFVPGGDPGRTPPKLLLALLERQKASLRRRHPALQMWVSPQSFSGEWFDEFLALLRTEPAWLDGVVYGPEVRVSLEELRRRVPRRYPIRDYPDITHSTHAQFVVPDWDLAHALTHGREPINPRPTDLATIFRQSQPHAIGSIAYSEGCNDDMNKVLWSALGWDPDADVTAVLRDYGRYFFGPAHADAFAQGALALERNWWGPLAANAGVETTLAQFQALERSAPPQLLQNWRFQMALYRAYYDAYNRRRLLHETAAEAEAMDALRQAQTLGVAAALAQAEATLDRAVAAPFAPDWRLRILQLAEALYQSVRMQLSVPHYQASDRERGATLDNLDVPLNDRGWLKARFAEIRQVAMELDQWRAVRGLLHWTNPGPGGFYDDLGDPSRQPHLVRPVAYRDDPGHLRNPLVGLARRPWERSAWRRSWLSNAETLFDAPLELHYTGLDPLARYRVRVVYGGEPSRARVMRLVADSRHELQPYRLVEALTEPVEFDVPQAATADGTLRLTWTKTPGLPGAGRGCQVAEVWLLRTDAP